MLNLTPWNKMPLEINWVTDNYNEYLQKCPPPPSHMKSVIQPLSELNITNIEEDYDSDELDEYDTIDISCQLCDGDLYNFDEIIYCTNRYCCSSFHTTCLAINMLESKEMIIPIEGKCPECEQTIIWKEAVIKKRKIESKLKIYENWVT